MNSTAATKDRPLSERDRNFRASTPDPVSIIVITGEMIEMSKKKIQLQ
jgi:hypothetical protein